MAKPGEFRAYLDRSLVVLANRSPQHLEEMRRMAPDLLVRMGVGDERFRVRPGPGPSWTLDDGPARITVSISLDSLVRILDGRMSIEESVFSGALQLQGALTEILAFHDALRVWIHGALRCYDFPRLYDEYLGG